MTPPDISDWRYRFAGEMFLDTADQNYIGARTAYFDHRYLDFWWSTLHAVEKYLKAILLMNDRPALKGAHDLVKLLEYVQGLDGRLTPPPFVRPIVEGLKEWPTIDVGSFIERLVEFGNADNRYDINGFMVSPQDLFMADQVVYWARRHARPLDVDPDTKLPRDWVEWLKSNPSEWQYWNAPLDRVAALPAHSTRRWPLIRLNAAFFPAKRHRLMRHYRAAGSVSSLEAAKLHLKHTAALSPQRAVVHASLAWVLENIRLPPREKADIQHLLKTYS